MSDRVRKYDRRRAGAGVRTFTGAVLLVALTALGCAGPSYERVYNRGGVTVRLRGDDGNAYQHPVDVSAAQLFPALGRLQVRMPDGKKVRTVDVVPADARSLVADGISEALKRARPDQAASVSIVHRERLLALLHRKYLTTFLVYRSDDRLHFDLSHVDWEIPKNWKKDTLPMAEPETEVMRFQILTIPGVVEVVAPQIATVRGVIADEGAEAP